MGFSHSLFTGLIRVDRITDVTWNKDALERLVLRVETKELIEAAVMAQGHRLRASPDIVSGKGPRAFYPFT